MTVRETWWSRGWSWAPGHKITAIGVTLMLLTLAGAVLRWIGLRDHGLWLDEIGEAVTASLPLSNLLEAVKSQAGAAPLDFVGVKAVTAALGDGTTTARLWAYAAGVLAIPLAYGAGRRLARSRLAGIVAAFLVAFSPFLILSSREARFYSLSVALTFGIVLIHQHARGRPFRTRRWLAYAAVVAAGVLTHYYIAMVPAALAVADLVTLAQRPRRRRTLALARGQLLGLCVAAAISMPWLLAALPLQLGRSYFWSVPAFTLELWSGMVSSLLTGSDATSGVASVALVVLLVLAGVGIARRRSTPTVALALLSIVMIPIVWVLASRSRYQLAPRQVIILLPLLYLLAGTGAVAVAAALHAARVSRLLPAVGILCVAGWVALVSGPLASGIGRSGQPSEDWPAAARFITTVRCINSEIYTNVGAGYAFGVGYYDPGLKAPRSWYRSEMGPSKTPSCGNRLNPAIWW